MLGVWQYRRGMNTVFLSIQLGLLVCAVPLFIVSLRTTRALRTRHGAYLATAIGLCVAASLVAVVSLAYVLDRARPWESVANFIPPLITIGTALIVIRRAMAALDGTAKRQARERRAAARAATAEDGEVATGTAPPDGAAS